MCKFWINRCLIVFAITCVLVTISNAESGPGNSDCIIAVVADCSVMGNLQCANINRPDLPTTCEEQGCLQLTYTDSSGNEITLWYCTSQVPPPGQNPVIQSQYRVKAGATINSLDPALPGQAGSSSFKYCKPLLACFEKKRCYLTCNPLTAADPNNPKCDRMIIGAVWEDVNEYWTISVEPGSSCVGMGVE